MITESLLTMIASLIKLIFGWISLPDLPSSITTVIDKLFDVLTSSIGLMGVFIDLSMVKLLLPVLLIVINFDEVWKFSMFIVRKIPFLNIR